MNKFKWTLGASALIFICGVAVFFEITSKPVASTNQSDNLEEHPGWFEQYMELKANENGEIPYGLKLKWYKEDQKNRVFAKKGVNNLGNIKEIGPNNVGGRTRSIIIDYNDDNTYYAGGVSGGLWKSTNAGAGWTKSNDFAPTLGVSSIIQSPFDHDVIYYGTGETVRGLINQNGLGIFRSRDGGKTFEHLEHTATSSFAEVWDVEHSLVHDSTIYVATSGAGLWRSTDGGDSFSRIYGSARNINEIRVFEDSTILIGVDGVGIVRINENTLFTVKLTGGLPAGGFGRVSLDYSRNFPKVIFAQFARSDNRDIASIYKSSDGGNSWTQKVTPTTINYSQAWYDFKLAVSPTDTNFVVSGAVNVGATLNGGSSWFGIVNSHSDYHEIQFFDNGNEFMVGNDGGVYRYSRNNLNSFANLNSGYNVTQYYAGYYAPVDDDLIAGAQDNGTHYSIDGSPGFASIFGADGSFCAIHQQDPGVLYFSYQNMNLRRRENNQNQNISNQIKSFIGFDDELVWFINPFEMNPLDGDQLYVPTKLNVFKSSNRGSTWSTMTNDLIGSTYAVGVSNDLNPTVYMGGTGSTLYRIDNAKEAQAGDEVMLFQLSPVLFRGSTIGCIAVDANDKGTIYVGMTNISNRGRIWKVTKADTDQPEWFDISSNLPESLPVNWVEVDPDNPDFIMVGTDYGLYTTVNGGGWWEKETRFPNVNIYQLRLRRSDRKLYIFTHGRGAWTADLAESPTAAIKDLVKEDVAINIYPNPVSTLLTVSGTQTESIQIYNRSGQMVKSSTNNKMNVADLTNGVYFVEVKHAEGISVKKIIISH